MTAGHGAGHGRPYVAYGHTSGPAPAHGCGRGGPSAHLRADAEGIPRSPGTVAAALPHRRPPPRPPATTCSPTRRGSPPRWGATRTRSVGSTSCGWRWPHRSVSSRGRGTTTPRRRPLPGCRAGARPPTYRPSSWYRGQGARTPLSSAQRRGAGATLPSRGSVCWWGRCGVCGGNRPPVGRGGGGVCSAPSAHSVVVDDAVRARATWAPSH
jgi:hypothetical protein